MQKNSPSKQPPSTGRGPATQQTGDSHATQQTRDGPATAEKTNNNSDQDMEITCTDDPAPVNHPSRMTPIDDRLKNIAGV